MALTVPVTFLSDARAKRKAPPSEDTLFHLAPHHGQALRDVAQGIEETDVGICCTYLVDQLSGEGADFDEHALNSVERYVESSLKFNRDTLLNMVKGWRQRIQRCRRALTLLRRSGDHTSPSILMIVYGHHDPITRQLPELLAMGQLGPLARYTDAVEEKRLELVRLEVKAHDSREVVNLRDWRERDRWVDRVISSSDALRAALVPFGEAAVVAAPEESVRSVEARKEARKAREHAHKERRDGFVTALRMETARMLAKAEGAYHHAWLASGAS